MAELRKVKVTKNADGSGGYTINGYFHKWGNFVTYEDNGAFSQTAAIVELLDDGIVKAYPVNRIKFVENF